jgi:Peptidase family S41
MRTRRRGVVFVLLALAALVAVACSSSEASDARANEAVPPAAAAEIRELVRRMDELHPDLYRSTSRGAFRLATDELVTSLRERTVDEARAGVMRLVALAGARNGHTGVFPLHANARSYRLYPLHLYRFADGFFVIGELGATSATQSRVVAVDGVPVDEVAGRIAPYVSRDNDWDLAARLPEYMVVAELLYVAGVTRSSSTATFTVEERGGGRRDVTLEPVSASRYAGAFGYFGRLQAAPGLAAARQPRYLRFSDRSRWIATLDRGRTIYVAYNETKAAYELVRELLRRVRARKVRRVVIDLRLNPGGDNTQYYDLLEALRRPIVARGGRLRVLIGRHTYSAAGNLAADVADSTRARLVGEPTGGSPSNWGDSTPVALPSLGLDVFVATSYQQFGDEDALATEPDVRVALTSADYFAGRDPVLEAALR